ncbi:unnamed protein product [Citrullus colocynthis]|uniref:Gnk2-homologous domain-containing protein n=1 Tax=Citrullus colocynthis TaxID=252529 RepID=A0ABP0YJT4_9ROSI
MEPPFVQHKCSDDVGNYTNSSPFKKNLDAVLNSISTNSQTDKGFYATAGEEPNRATALWRFVVVLFRWKIVEFV